mgnify:CR=1 FL=1
MKNKIFTNKTGKKLLMHIILWLLLAIVFIIPIIVAGVDSMSASGVVNVNVFGEIVFNYIIDIGSRVKAFQELYKSTTLRILGYYTFFYYAFVLVWFLKKSNGGDGDFHDIEHGSSDWSENGEQYKVLSKKSGIILAEKNYLPVDKSGNINVLIVGRIWCW